MDYKLTSANSNNSNNSSNGKQWTSIKLTMGIIMGKQDTDKQVDIMVGQTMEASARGGVGYPNLRPISYPEAR